MGSISAGHGCWKESLLVYRRTTAAAVDHGDRRGAQAGWFGGCDRRALRGRSLAWELRSLSRHPARHFTKVKDILHGTMRPRILVCLSQGHQIERHEH